MIDELRPEGKGNIRLIRTSHVPGYRTRILVVDRDPSAVAVVRSILRAQDWEVISAKTAAEALEKARLEGPDAIILELSLADMNGVELCQVLRRRTETAETPIMVLSASTSVTDRVASLRAGATDYLVKPPDAQELIARLKAALDLRKEKAGFVISVLGVKGGVGTSTLAVNLAVALRQETRRGVVLLDTAVPNGMVDIMLNLQPAAGVGQILPRLDELEKADFEAILTAHASGVEALLLHDVGVEGIQPDELRKVLLALRRMRDFVVVDTWPVLDDNTATILDVADRVLLVLTPEITSLRGAKLFLERTRQMGLSRERVVPVLNRSPLRGGLQRRDIENALGVSMQAAVPDDSKLITYSINRGVPILESHRTSSVSRQISDLARSLVRVAQQQR